MPSARRVFPIEPDELAPAETPMSSLFAGCRNLFGPLGPDQRRRLQAFFDHPSVATWDGVYSIIVCTEPRWTTVWQAVIAVAPEFRDIARSVPASRKRPGPGDSWRAHPDALTVARAIRQACAASAADDPPAAHR